MFIAKNKLQILTGIVLSLCMSAVSPAYGKVNTGSSMENREKSGKILPRSGTFFKGMLRGMPKTGKVYKKTEKPISYFNDNKLQVIIKKIEPNRILINLFGKTDSINLVDSLIVINKNENSIELNTIPTPCNAYISIGRNSIEGLFVFFIQYISPVQESPDGVFGLQNSNRTPK